MGKRDIRTVEYFSDNRRFADLINARFFHGEQVVKSENLRESNKELNHSETMGRKKIGRDNVMKWMGDTLLAVFVLEHQNKVDYHMVQRIMLAEAMEYERQWKEKKKRHREKKDLKNSAEYLSGIKKGEKFTPVVTLVVYYGEEPYDGATTLHETIGWTEETEYLKEYISDYRINVFDYHKQEKFEEYHTELKVLFEFMRYASDKEKLQKVIAEQKKAQYNIDRETYEMIAEMTDIEELLPYEQKCEKKEERNMGNAIRELIADGREEGFTAGKVESILEFLGELGTVPTELDEKISAEKDLNVLRKWLKTAAHVNSVEEFMKNM